MTSGELLNIKDVSVVGVLLAGIFIVGRMWINNVKKQDDERKKEKAEDKKERQDMYDKLQAKNEQMYEEEKSRHAEEEKELKVEIKRLHQREEKRDEKWLNALNDNTSQLKNMADKLQIIPAIQEDVDSMKEDIEIIKTKIK